MTYNPQRPGRRSPRLKDYDYSQEGAYFVTVCTQHRLSLFGEVVKSEMRRNMAGEMIAACWEDIPLKLPDVELDLYCVMPNHFHGIVVIIRDYIGGNADVGAGRRARPRDDVDVGAGRVRPTEVPSGARPATSLITVMQRFKSLTTHAYMRGVQEQNWPSYHGKLWRRSFHDPIIRSENGLHKLRAYIQQNPARWEADEFYG
jgi:REP element-mobilizing transposase RayT